MNRQRIRAIVLLDTMYEFVSISAIVIGTALVLVVFVRKVPALAELSEGDRIPGIKFTRKFTAWLKRIDWARYKSVGFGFLAALIERLRRFSVRFARRSETSVKSLRAQVRKLSGGEEKGSVAFSSRIKKRSAFLEEERQLIEQLTANPEDTDSYRRLGNLYMIAGNTRDARAAFTELLRLVPDDESATLRLSELDSTEKKEDAN